MGNQPVLFAVPIIDQFLIYAPIHNFSAVVDSRTVRILNEKIENNQEQALPLINEMKLLRERPGKKPQETCTGPITNPLFLGLITTRGCNMGCKYCDFAAPKANSPVMSLSLVRDSIDAYFNVLLHCGGQTARIEFFGGEPLYPGKVVEFAVCYAREQARQNHIAVRFEITTNGLASPERCKWVSDNFDRIILSMDGPADIQNLHRPLRNGSPSFGRVFHSAKIFSEGSADFTIRTCVSQESVGQLPEIAKWIAENFVCDSVCFEALIPSSLSVENHLVPPDPWQFGKQVCLAGDILSAYGIEQVTSGTNIDAIQKSFCPVGKDALIVSPEGSINACYLMKDDWEKEGLNLEFGKVWEKPLEIARFAIEQNSLDDIRLLASSESESCSCCLCQYHCAGGCHVKHKKLRFFDPVCIQTRLITISKLLKRLGAYDLNHEWLGNKDSQTISVLQSNDCLL